MADTTKQIEKVTQHPGIDIVVDPAFSEHYGKPQHSKIDPVGDILRVPTENNGIFDILPDGKVTRSISSKQFNLAELLDVEFPELHWYVEELITTGLTLFWGYAKSGKSILILHILLAISAGGRALGAIKVKRAAVLLISLEDGPRRIQSRLKAAGAQPNDNFTIFFDWPRGSRGVERLAEYLGKNPDIKIVVIDTLFLLSRPKDGNDYTEMVVLMESLKKIADDRDICMVCLHHSKKTGKFDSADFAESALGSTGFVSGPDHLLFLKRTPSGPSDAALYFRSKDAEGAEMALDFDQDIGGWLYRGEVSDLADTDEQQEILDALRKNAGPMTAGDIKDAIRKTKQATNNILSRMVKNELIRKVTRGIYTLPTTEGGSQPPFTACTGLQEVGKQAAEYTSTPSQAPFDDSEKLSDNGLDIF